MNYMFQPGFLGTKAPFFMDFVTLIVALLPLLVGIAISFAKNKNYTLHARVQWLIFIVSVTVVSYFEYGVRVGGGFETFAKESSLMGSVLERLGADSDIFRPKRKLRSNYFIVLFYHYY